MALYYIATVTLHMSENEFWRCTLRKLHALHRFHTEHRQSRTKGHPLEELFA